MDPSGFYFGYFAIKLLKTCKQKPLKQPLISGLIFLEAVKKNYSNNVLKYL